MKKKSEFILMSRSFNMCNLTKYATFDSFDSLAIAAHRNTANTQISS